MTDSGERRATARSPMIAVLLTLVAGCSSGDPAVSEACANLRDADWPALKDSAATIQVKEHAELERALSDVSAHALPDSDPGFVGHREPMLPHDESLRRAWSGCASEVDGFPAISADFERVLGDLDSRVEELRARSRSASGD